MARATTQRTVPLEVINIANPCPADWDEMRGDDRVRFCNHCSLHVYNLSGMSREAAERLVAENEGRLCVRMYRREDGTVITKDCEGALLLAARRVKRWAAAGMAFALWAVLAPLGLSRAIGSQTRIEVQPVNVNPPRYSEVKGEAFIPQPQIMGRMVRPATNPVQPPMPVPLMGTPCPLPLPPPATQPAPATTQAAQ